MKVTISLKDGYEKMCMPERMSSGASGFDLKAALDAPVLLPAGERKLIPSGVFMAMPEGMEAQVRPRSGLALKHGITVLNTPGTIDSDYRGEIGVILYNTDSRPFKIEPGMRIAQLVFADVTVPEINTALEIEQTERSSGGFGHTGT